MMNFNLKSIAEEISSILNSNGVEFTYSIDGRVLELGLVPKLEDNTEPPETFWEFPFDLQYHLALDTEEDKPFKVGE
jgi:hypothetical protein